MFRAAMLLHPPTPHVHVHLQADVRCPLPPPSPLAPCVHSLFALVFASICVWDPSSLVSSTSPPLIVIGVLPTAGKPSLA